MRHIIGLTVTNREENGNETGYRTHVITLSNKEAVERVVETICDGVGAWDDVVTRDDVLVWIEEDSR